MDKSTKQITDLSKEFMAAWKKGWPEYYEEPTDDQPSIMLIAEKCYGYFKIRLWHKDGHDRVIKAIENIAFHCRYSEKFAPKNLRYINLAFQRVFNEMAAKKRMQDIRSGNYNYRK